MYFYIIRTNFRLSWLPFMAPLVVDKPFGFYSLIIRHLGLYIFIHVSAVIKEIN